MPQVQEGPPVHPALYAIEQRMDAPTARGLAAAVGRAVGDGVLADSDKLPPIRAVATQLGLSPTTVSAAWGLLARAGTVHTDGRRGTVITIRRPGPSRYRTALAADSLFQLDLSTGAPDPALLPDLTAALRRIRPPDEPGTYLDDPVLPELGELLRADWPFPAERITVVDGAMDALQLITTTHLRIGGRVAVENPCFPPLLDLLDAAGVTALPVDVDDDGPQPDQLTHAITGGARAVFIQPRWHNPTGASITASRADTLTRVLADTDTLIIEDDSAGPIANTPAVSLGTQLPTHTLHVRSYSKSHGPDLRLAALGGPAELVDPIVDRRFLGQGWTSRLLQRILVDLLTDSHSIRAVHHARREYARRRDAVVSRLAKAGLSIGGKDGLNIWIPVVNEATALLVLATHGIGASAGEPFAVNPGQTPHLRVTVGLAAADHAELAAALADAAHAGARAAAR